MTLELSALRVSTKSMKSWADFIAQGEIIGTSDLESRNRIPWSTQHRIPPLRKCAQDAAPSAILPLN